jgi:hypothetical protein
VLGAIERRAALIQGPRRTLKFVLFFGHIRLMLLFGMAPFAGGRERHLPCRHAFSSA